MIATKGDDSRKGLAILRGTFLFGISRRSACQD